MRKQPFKKRLLTFVVGVLGKIFLYAIGTPVRFCFILNGKQLSGKPLRDAEAKLRQDGGPILWAMFHGTHFPILYRFRHRNICVVTSRSSDGQILARLLEGVGYQTVAGSSSRGGTSVTIKLARVVTGGDDAGIAVDGPRGPGWKVKPGIILLGKITGRPIVPIVATPKTFWRFQSWDRFRFPLGFTKSYISSGQPMRVPSDAGKEEMEALRAELQRRMKALHDELEARVSPRVFCLPDRNPRDKKEKSQGK